MRKRAIACLLLMGLLLAVMPSTGLAAKKPAIKLGVKLGLMYAGDTAQLKPKLSGVSRDDVGFESSAPAVAAVTAGGAVQALAEGRAIITVSGGGAQARCGVVVLPRRVSLAVGGRLSLPNGTVERYRVKDADVAAISKDGVISGLKAGTTMVAVKYGSQVRLIDVEVVPGGAAEAAAGAGDASTPADPTASGSRAARLDAAGQTDQIVLVEYTGGSDATLTLHEKQGGVWRQLMETSAYVGKNGIDKAKEGDKRTPTGTYNLNTPFGIKDDPGANMTYTKVTKYHYWCGSSSSEYYNQLVDSRVTGRGYTSSDEHLIDYGSAYHYCMFIDYNAAGVAGKGSCIFLHCKGKNRYTAGCVAVDESSMKKIIQWARPGVKIVIQAA